MIKNYVHFLSNFVETKPVGTIERWGSDKKAKKQIPCRKIILFYNEGIGGVDLCNTFLSHYCIIVKTKRWYIKFFWHCIDIAKVSSWLMYKRHCHEKGIVNKSLLSLLQFILKITDALIHANRQMEPDTTPRKAGRPRTPKI